MFDVFRLSDSTSLWINIMYLDTSVEMVEKCFLDAFLSQFKRLEGDIKGEIKKTAVISRELEQFTSDGFTARPFLHIS